LKNKQGLKRDVQANKVVRNNFAESVSPLCREHQECIAEVEWRLLKAAVVSSVTRVCWLKRLGAAHNGKKSNSFVDPSGKRCYSSNESSVQGLASEQSRHFFHSRYTHEERWSAALTVKRPKCDLGRISGINWVPLAGKTTYVLANRILAEKDIILVDRSKTIWCPIH